VLTLMVAALKNINYGTIVDDNRNVSEREHRETVCGEKKWAVDYTMSRQEVEEL
jgi:hypothetical protein